MAAVAAVLLLLCHVPAVTICPTLAGNNEVADPFSCGDNATVGDTCTFACEEGTEESGSAVYTCDQASKVWLGGSLTCIGEPHLAWLLSRSP